MVSDTRVSPLPRSRIGVLDSEMAYHESGTGDPIVFLHGNPTHADLWRNVIPHVAGLGRVIAPDLIGMGESSKLPESGPDRYRFVEHRRYLDVLLEKLGVRERVVLVVHDWGSALGFDWARRHADAVRGIAYMEAIVQPLEWEEFGDFGEIFRKLRSDEGERMILEENAFVEVILPFLVLSPLPPQVHDLYRRPFLERGEARRPTLTWPREIPLGGEPADVVEIVGRYAQWLARSPLPKLFVNAEPGAALSGSARDFCRTWPNQTEVTVPGVHFVQEDSPDAIGRAIHDWLVTSSE